MSFIITNTSTVSQGPFGFSTQTTITTNATFTVTNALIRDFINDPSLRSAAAQSNISITVGSSIFSGNDAVSYLDLLGPTFLASFGIGQTTMSQSIPVTFASDQTASVLPTGAASDTTVAKLTLTQASTTASQTGPLIQGAVTTSAPSYSTSQTNPFSLNTSGGLRVDGSGITQPVSGTFWQTTQPISDANLELSQASTTSGQVGPLIQGATTTSAPSYSTAKTNPLSLTTSGLLRVDASGTRAPIDPPRAGSATLTQVASSATSVTLLASNTNRHSAILYNSSTQIAYVAFGATATSSAYTFQMGPNTLQIIEIGFIYTGAISAIWASANGNMIITEY